MLATAVTVGVAILAQPATAAWAVNELVDPKTLPLFTTPARILSSTAHWNTPKWKMPDEFDW